jgi:acetyl esterase/lipase
VASPSGHEPRLRQTIRVDGDGDGVIIVVEGPSTRRDDCQRLARQLRENGAEVRLDVVDGLDHEYPPDFDDRLPEAMTWVLQGGN